MVLAGIVLLVTSTGVLYVNGEPGIDKLVQGYIITKKGDKTVALGDIDRKVVGKSGNGSEIMQKALNLLEKAGGGKLEIKPGEYTIQTKLIIPSCVSIVGSGKATRFLLGDQNARGDGIIFYADQKDNVLLSDFTCLGISGNEKSSAVVFNGCGFSMIKNVSAHNFSGFGFYIRGNSFACTLENNLTSGNDRAGTKIEQTQKSRAGRFVPNNINNCVSYAEDGFGFEFEQGICQNMVGCTVYLAKNDGIYMHNSTSNLISGCRVFMGFRNGITIESTHEMNISGNIVGWNNRQNLELNHCVWGTVTANEFIDAGGRRDPEYSVYLHRGTKSIQITGNAIFNWHDNQVMKGGIFEDSDCLENQITNNVINYYRDFDVKSLGKNSLSQFNMGLPHAYGSPNTPDVPNVRPEDIKLHLDNDESRGLAEEYLKSLMNVK
jgi:parallel beta-helix repeat protein